MAPGPTPVPPEVLLAMARPMIHHRTPEYEALFREVRAGLKRLFQTTQDVLPFAASGTGAMEAAVVNTLSAGDTALVLRAGAFGERWEQICRAYGVDVIALTAPFGETVPPAAVADALARHPGVRAVLVQHSESSTGVLHDVKGIAAVTRQTPAILVVDAVSSLGIADLRMDEWGVDMVVSGSQKGLMLPPGLSFCGVSERAWGHVARSRLPKYYFDLAAERASQAAKRGALHPGRLPHARAPRGAPDDRRRDLARDAAGATSGWPGPRGPGWRRSGSSCSPGPTPSPALTAVVAPPGVDGETVVAAYSAAHNITIAGGQGEMKGRVFRLGHMGYVGDFDVLAALAALEQVLHALGQPVDFGAAVRAAQKVFAEGA